MQNNNYNGPDSEKIKNIFSEVAYSYDKTNNAMTFGLAHLWRKKIVKMSQIPPQGKVLDCATGTGDLALEFKKAYPQSEVVGIDFSKEMLDLAPQKAQQKDLSIEFKIGDILNLEFSDASFDAVSVAYGIRNVADPEKGLAEMWRVLKSGGKLLILETGDDRSLLSLPVRLYTKYLIPRIGAFVSKKKEAYKYLSSSSQRFPSKTEFLDWGKDLPHLKKSSYKSLMLGASYIYCFEKE